MTPEEEQTTSVDAHLWLINEGYPLTMPISRDTLGDIINRYVHYTGAKWQVKEAKPTPVKGDEVKSIDEIGKKYFQCNCGEIYLSRNLTAPDCPYHSLDWESAMEEYANQFKTNKND